MFATYKILELQDLIQNQKFIFYVISVKFMQTAHCGHRSQLPQLLGWAFVHTEVDTPFVLPLLLFFSSHSMTSVKRTSFPENFPSTRTRTRVSRKQVMLTVSMWIHWSTENRMQRDLLPCSWLLPWRQFQELQQVTCLNQEKFNTHKLICMPFLTFLEPRNY